MTIIGRAHSILTRGDARVGSSLTASQLRMDAMLDSFASQASDPTALASMMLGGLAGRTLRLGLLNVSSSLLFRPLVQGVSLLGESAVFEFSHRAGQILKGEGSRELLRWSGNQGLALGIAHSSLSFGIFKALHPLLPHNNFLLQQGIQTSGLVLAHHAARFLGLEENRHQSLMEEFAEAAVTNLQLQASASLSNLLFPSISFFEKSMEAAIEARTHISEPSHANFTHPFRLSVFRAESELVEINQRLSPENFEEVKSRALASQGKDLVLGFASESSPESLHATARLWLELLPQAAQYRSLRMEVGGMRLRYREFPREFSVEDVQVSRDQTVGTVIEIPSTADFESVHSFLRSLHEQWNTIQAEVSATEAQFYHIRGLYSPNIAKLIRKNIYAHYGEMRTWMHGVLPELMVMNEALKLGNSLDEGQRGRLGEIKRLDQKWTKDLRSYGETWKWMEDHRLVVEGEEVLDGPGVRQVLHDLNNRLSALLTLNAEVSFLEKGMVLNEGLIHAGETSTYLSISSAVSEGAGIATALASRAGIPIDTLPGISCRFQEVLLHEDPELEFALMDVMGNLLSNALRYSDPAKGPEALLPRITAHFIREGDLEMTVFDQGIGILPENFDRLGEDGYREARKEVNGSSGHGVASVIQILRERAWGPLWVRSIPGEGSAFRFVIPKNAFNRTESFNPDREDEDTMRPPDSLSYVERNLSEGFRVPAASMDMAIQALLKQVPSEKPTMDIIDRIFEGIVTGDFQFRRLEALHRLLMAYVPEGRMRAVDNAHGPIPFTFVTLARLGTHVWTKEPDDIVKADEFISEDDLSVEMRARIHRTDKGSMNDALGVRASYWSNPNYGSFIIPEGYELSSYLGRDVEVGGYLVIQNGRGVFEAQTRALKFDSSLWQVVYQSPVNEAYAKNADYVLPTGSSDRPNALFVYRRIR